MWLKRAGFKLVLISNQSGVGRGFFTAQTVKKIHDRLQKIFTKRNARLDGFYFCPHLPDAGCKCRKPNPGLAEMAASQLHLDLKKSYVVGDQKRDLELAANIGARGVLVLTGAGKEALKGIGKNSHVSRDLFTAAKWIIENEK